MKYFIAVAFVWLGCTLAWVVLASTLLYRSGEMSSELTTEVDRLWGPPLQQEPPSVVYQEPKKVTEKVVTTDAQGKSVEQQVEREVDQTLSLPLLGSDVRVALRLEHRQKGLLWFPTYAVDFDSKYEFKNGTAVPRNVTALFPLETGNSVYDGFRITDASGAARSIAVASDGARFTTTLAPGERLTFGVRYKARGRSAWRYSLSRGAGRVDQFRMVVTTDFPNVDFPAGSLSPSKHALNNGGWQGEWRFDSLVASAGIGIELPQKLNPGPLASRITFFAPVGLLFFLFVASVLGAAKKMRLHPMHYFFIGCAFFAFHLLFAYTVDHITLATAFLLSSSVSLVLVVSYAHWFMGLKRALLFLALPQLLYLVLFSATFFWQGFTGLAIAVGAILTLFVIMQIVGRVRWDETFERRPLAPHAPVAGAAAP
jgi:inner membrane protein involved in colicin E2 resistance